MKNWYVYIMANNFNTVIYIGCTNDIESRVLEHKHKIYKNAFTARYNCNKLVYFEEFENGANAAKREKQMKKWKREWKNNLIENMNPNWMDISMNWSNSVNSIYNIKRFLPTQE